jgi:serine protease Do
MRRPDSMMPRAAGIGRPTLFWLIPLVALAACSVAPPRQLAEKPLVRDDAPIFDQTFRDIALGDLELADFWIEAEPASGDDAVPLHHRTVADLVAQTRDGVVNIYTRVLQERKALFGISPNELLPIRIPLLSAVFDIVPWKVPIPFQTEGFSLGSGFLINPHGFILTNAHVVFNATDIQVVFSGRREEAPASIVGMDRLTDTALLRVETDFPLTALPLSDSDDLSVGEMVVAVGNPLGLNHSVTFGLVSAKERVVPGPQIQLLDLLQTDSAINPGSSGGPLLNLRGEVVGINTALISDAQSIGFAVPINTVKEVLPLLIVNRTQRGWLGVSARPLAPGEAKQLGYADPRGILVESVAAGSPAEASGIETGDLIVRVGDQEIDSFVRLSRQLLRLLPGDEIHVTLFRRGDLIDITSTLVENPES